MNSDGEMEQALGPGSLGPSVSTSLCLPRMGSWLPTPCPLASLPPRGLNVGSNKIGDLWIGSGYLGVGQVTAIPLPGPPSGLPVSSELGVVGPWKGETDFQSKCPWWGLCSFILYQALK